MRWYLASRTRHQDELKKVVQFLEAKHQIVVADWINGEIFSNFETQEERIQKFSKGVVQSILNSDIFILISDQAGTDMFVELGIALAHKELGDRKRIYIVGDHSRRSVMQLHPSITHAKTLAEVFIQEEIDHTDFKVPKFI